jgi:ABC-type multidrug transport system fused ATPase/permease subunit
MLFPKKLSRFYEKYLPFFNILSKKDKKVYLLVIVVQSFNALLDITGIFLVGTVAILVTSYLIGSNLDDQVLIFTKLLELDNYSPKTVLFIFSLTTIIFFIFKTVFSIYINREILVFYAKKQSDFSASLFSKILNSSYVWFKNQNNERIYTALSIGPNALFMRIIGNSLLIFSDVLLLVLILAFLFIFNPVVSIFTFIFFLLFAIILQKVIGKKARTYGEDYIGSEMISHEYLNVMASSFKEIFVMNKKDHFEYGFQNSENIKALSSAKMLWIQLLPKYVFEIALTLGIFILSFTLLTSNVNNIATLTVFIVASGRIVPALFRIQSSFLNLITGYANALVTLEFLSDLQVRTDLIPETISYALKNPPSIKMQSVSFKFPDSSDYLFENVSINIDSGEAIALVGKSGSGKTTIVDLLLNIYLPSKGAVVLTDGLIEIKPGNVTNISYVPQSPIIFKGTVLENIVFRKNDFSFDKDALEYAIRGANLDDLIKKLPKGLNTELGNLNGFLSGGEKQRIAIARALYIKPKLLVIDEGTSSLDYSSENLITQTLKSLEGDVTMIIIAHRITTIKNIQKIYFMDDCKIVGSGNYNELQKAVPQFADWVNSLN